MAALSHLITCLAPDGPYHQEDRVGLTYDEAASFIADGTSHPLVSVHAVDFTAGTVTDVTCSILHRAVDVWRSLNEDVPGSLWAACEAYDVERHDLEDGVDENDEHRLTASDLGLSRAA